MSSPNQFRLSSIDLSLVETSLHALKRTRERLALNVPHSRSLDRVIWALERMPESTPGLNLTISWSRRNEDSYAAWTLEFDSGMLSLGVGGYHSGPYGSDSFSNYQYTLYLGASGVGVESQDEHDHWFDGLLAWLNQEPEFEINDQSLE